MKALWNLTVKFFNTPIKKYGIDGKEIVDNSPRVSMLTGVVIILVGAVIVTISLFLFFAFIA